MQHGPRGRLCSAPAALGRERGDAQLMRNKLGLQVFGLSSLRAWWCACAHARVLGLVRVHYRTRRLEEWRDCSREPGTTLRWTNAWNC